VIQLSGPVQRCGLPEVIAPLAPSCVLSGRGNEQIAAGFDQTFSGRCPSPLLTSVLITSVDNLPGTGSPTVFAPSMKRGSQKRGNACPNVTQDKLYEIL
jgi:hypothetical protein